MIERKVHNQADNLQQQKINNERKSFIFLYSLLFFLIAKCMNDCLFLFIKFIVAVVGWPLYIYVVLVGVYCKLFNESLLIQRESLVAVSSVYGKSLGRYYVHFTICLKNSNYSVCVCKETTI